MTISYTNYPISHTITLSRTRVPLLAVEQEVTDRQYGGLSCTYAI